MPRGSGRQVRPISHDDRLSIVEHLDELRTRLIFSAIAFVVAWGLCGWQNHLILELLNNPLPGKLHPITLGPAEPFYVTLTNSAYAAILLSLPVILYQLYAFILPAFKPSERRLALPLLVLAPVLFIAGAAFCYFVVLTPAMHFLLNFNSDQFNIEVRARDYYSFIMMLLMAMGFGFQMPIAIVAACRIGLVTPKKLRKSRGYAVVAIAILASLLPTLDPVTLLLEMAPLVALYELSIWLATLVTPRADDVPDEVAAAER
jgi:sec-independent protein translocase protein TatC